LSAAFFAARTASADVTPVAAPPPVAPLRTGFSVAILAGYGLDIPIDDGAGNDTGSDNPFGPGAGLRASYRFGPGLTTSATAERYFGLGSNGSPQLLTLQFELGWAFDAGPLVIEPFAGIGAGLWQRTTELCSRITGQCSSSSSSSVLGAAKIGLGASLPIDDTWFLGARVELLGSVGPALGVPIFVTGGARF
jgi:hypothetical protein